MMKTTQSPLRLNELLGVTAERVRRTSRCSGAPDWGQITFERVENLNLVAKPDP